MLLVSEPSFAPSDINSAWQKISSLRSLTNESAARDYRHKMIVDGKKNIHRLYRSGRISCLVLVLGILKLCKAERVRCYAM